MFDDDPITPVTVIDTEPINTPEQAENDEAALIMNLESTIKNHMVNIEKLEEEYSKHKDMLAATFENDETYREHAEEAKKANKVKSATKAQILKQPQVAEIAAKVREMTAELKDLKNALSDYLGEFNRISGITEIEGADGELREIVYVAKLVRKSTPRK